MSKVVVIGGGFSGVVSAIYASQKNEVIILERNDTILKKLLLTGNGRCNYFNDNQELSNYNSSNEDLITKIINEKNLEELKKFYNKIGIVPKIKNGYYYPYSNQAVSVKCALMSKLNEGKVKIVTDYLVDSIKKEDNKFIINNDITCDKVILSTGGASYQITGSDGKGYELLKKLDLKVADIYPSLTSFICEDPYLKKLSGVRCEAKVSIYNDGKMLKEELGELQLTDYGVSGICVFNISNLYYKYSGKKEVHINFMPFLNSKDELIMYLDNRDVTMNYKKISELLNGILNTKIINIIIDKTNLRDIKYKSLSYKEKEKLADTIINYVMPILDTKSFEKAQTTVGGLLLSEVDNNMMAKKIKDLYVVGELLDIDGICGGYNLTHSFISAYLAGSNI